MNDIHPMALFRYSVLETRTVKGLQLKLCLGTVKVGPHEAKWYLGSDA